jgi:hypothetical protein
VHGKVQYSCKTTTPHLIENDAKEGEKGQDQVEEVGLKIYRPLVVALDGRNGTDQNDGSTLVHCSGQREEHQSPGLTGMSSKLRP